MNFKEQVFVVVSATQRGVLSTFDHFVMHKSIRNRLVSVSKDRRTVVLKDGMEFIFIDEGQISPFQSRKSVKIVSDLDFEENFMADLMKKEVNADD